MTPDDAIIEAHRLLRRLARAQATKRSLKRSYDLQKADLDQAEADARAGLAALVERYGPITTVAGTAGPSKGWTTERDDAVLIEWLEANNREALVKRSVSMAELEAAGGKWAKDVFLLEGEALPGITRARSEGISVSLAKSDPDDDEWEDEG